MLLLAILAISCDKINPVPGPGPSPEPDPQKKEYKEDIPESFKDEADDPAADPSGVFDYSVLAKKGHPRLLMDTQDFGELKEKMSGDNRLENMTLYKIHKLILDNAAVIVSDPDPIKYQLDASGKRLLAQSRIALKRLSTMAYAYRLTGKEEYLAKASSDLETVCGFSDWHPSHYLDVAEMTLGVAIAYDWLYYKLDNDLRAKVRNRLLEYAIKTSYTHSFHETYNNWNQVCNGGIIAAAVATYEKNKAESVKAIELGIDSNKKVMASIYSPDGNYGEGYSYWEYGTSYEIVLLSILEQAFGDMAGLEKTPGFMSTAEYMLYMDGAAKIDFSYADGGSNKESCKLPMWWFASKKNDPGLLMTEGRLLESNLYPKSASDESRLLPLVPAFVGKFKPENLSSAVPAKKMWYGNGLVPVAMVHTSWSFKEDDCYVGVKGGSPSSSHSHMDGGSFVFDAKGKRWAQDYTRPTYATMEVELGKVGGNFWSFAQKSMRWDIVKMNNLAHNTLCFRNTDGSVSKLHVTDQVVSGKAVFTEIYDKDDNNLGVCMDLSSLYTDQAASVTRTILMKNLSSLEIIDKIEAKPGMDAKMEWRMLTPATSVTVATDGITLAQGGKSLILSASSSAAINYQKWAVARPDDWKAGSTWDSGLSGNIVGWSATIPAGQSVTFTTTLK